jgi:MOSC domain-containing protein YiiM/catechol 2,3-dioxygenase-like lactoylglutathione lyase family enzyme
VTRRGAIHSINVSGGGVPKHRIAVGEITRSGLVGDAHAKPEIHGGPHQALSLFALERIEALAREGHPIEPGSTGENVTTRGLDWEQVTPGTCLRLGERVVIRITGFAAPCRTIRASFHDGRFARLNQLLAPGGSRVYAEVLAEGTIRPGDAIEWVDASEAAPDAARQGGAMQIAYVNVYVTDLDRSVEFFERTLGLAKQFADARFGYASFDAGPIRLGVARIDPEDDATRGLVGRQTGVGFGVADLEARHKELVEKGVAFAMPPARQPWGGFMGLFADPDGNLFYLDQLQGR